MIIRLWWSLSVRWSAVQIGCWKPQSFVQFNSLSKKFSLSRMSWLSDYCGNFPFRWSAVQIRVAGVGWLSCTAAETLRAFVELVFANFRDKNVVFTISGKKGNLCVESLNAQAFVQIDSLLRTSSSSDDKGHVIRWSLSSMGSALQVDCWKPQAFDFVQIHSLSRKFSLLIIRWSSDYGGHFLPGDHPWYFVQISLLRTSWSSDYGGDVWSCCHFLCSMWSAPGI